MPTLTLPQPGQLTKPIFVENSGSGTLTIDPNGLQIDGISASLSLAPNQGVVIFTDAFNYFTMRGMGFANPLTTEGDIVFENALLVPDRLGIGITAQVLTVVAGLPVWATPAFVSPLTTAGDLLYENATPAPARLAIGSTGQVLTVSGGLPAWSAATGFSNPMTSAGDLILGGSSGTATRLAIGSSAQVLTVSGGTAVWANASSGFANPMTTAGDLITGGSGGSAGRLGIGSNGQVLTVVGGAPAWGSGGGGGSIGGVSVKTASYAAVSGDNGTLLAFNPTGVSSSAQAVSYTGKGGDGTGSSVTTVAASSVNTAARDAIIVAVRNNTATTQVLIVNDTAGNVYQRAIRNTGSQNLEIWFATNAIANASNVVTATLSGADTFTFIYVWGVTNTAFMTSALDATAIGSGTGTTATTAAFTTAQADEISIAVVNTNSGGITFSAGTGYTLDDGTFPTSTTSDYGGAEHRLFTTIQTGVTAGFTWTGSHGWGINVATFKRAPETLILTLPASPPSSTWMTFVSNFGTGLVDISPNGLDINGALADIFLTPGESLAIFTDGTNYFTFGSL